MQYREYLYQKVAEEAGEIVQMAIKTSLFGEDSTDPRVENGDTNRVALEKEFNDLIAVFSLLNEHFDPTMKTVAYDTHDSHLDNKRIKLKEMFSQISHMRLKGEV